jgi:hypothetical protein
MNHEPLTTFLQNLKTDLLNSLQANGKQASGQSDAQMVITADDEGGRLEIPGYMQLLETGRAPTSANPLPANPPMIQRIQQWCQEKGIPDKAAWAIKKSIDKKGYKGLAGIVSVPLGDANINQRLNQALDDIGDNLLDDLSKKLDEIIP